MYNEHRRFQRINHSLSAQIEYISLSGKREKFKTKLANISASGVGVLLPRWFTGLVAVRSRAQIILARKRDRVNWSGYVARQGITEEGEPILGIEFDKCRYDAIAKLTEHVSITIELKEPEMTLAQFTQMESLA